MPKTRPTWKSYQRYEKDKRAQERAQAKPTQVSCPICAAKRGELCVFVDTGRRRKKPHPARRTKAQQILRARQRRMMHVRAKRAERFATVTRYFVCPICGGDHSRSDHASATTTLRARAAKVR